MKTKKDKIIELFNLIDIKSLPNKKFNLVFEIPKSETTALKKHSRKLETTEFDCTLFDSIDIFTSIDGYDVETIETVAFTKMSPFNTDSIVSFSNKLVDIAGTDFKNRGILQEIEINQIRDGLWEGRYWNKESNDISMLIEINANELTFRFLLK